MRNGNEIVNLCIGKSHNQTVLSYSFQEMFFISQNLKHVYMTYIFLSFWSSLINSIKYLLFEVYMYIQTRKDISHETKTNRYTSSPVSDIDVQNFWEFHWRVKILYRQFLIFLSFMNVFRNKRFRKGVKLNRFFKCLFYYVLIIFSSPQHVLDRYDV